MSAHVVLGHGECVVQVHHAMPPVARDEDRLPRMLDAEDGAKMGISQALSRQEVQEMVAYKPRARKQSSS